MKRLFAVVLTVCLLLGMMVLNGSLLPHAAAAEESQNIRLFFHLFGSHCKECNGKLTECTLCEGSGVCTKCDNAGQHICPNCNGDPSCTKCTDGISGIQQTKPETKSKSRNTPVYNDVNSRC